MIWASAAQESTCFVSSSGASALLLLSETVAPWIRTADSLDESRTPPDAVWASAIICQSM